MTRSVATAWLFVLASACSSGRTDDDAVTDSDADAAQDSDAGVGEDVDGASDVPSVCWGRGTADLRAGPDGCATEWIHGEQMCPVRSVCGRAISCIAYSDWSAGTCVCPEARDDTFCELTVAAPAEGSVFTTDDDEDPSRPGIQVSLTVELECCLNQCAGIRVEAARVDRTLPPTELFLDATGRATGLLDLGETGDCQHFGVVAPDCARMVPIDLCVGE